MAIDWTKIYKKYKGLWVALLDDQKTVVGSGKTLMAALKGANQKGHSNPIVMRVPAEIIPYVGGACS
jgi:hypothetical protein